MSKISRNLIIAITFLFVLLTILKSFYFSAKNGGTDLRIRIVGTRLLSTNHSPYFYKWNPSDGEFFLEPNTDVRRVVNGNIVTPAVMYTIYPLAQLPYPQIRLWWTILQLLAGLSCIFLILKKYAGSWLMPACLTFLGLFSTDIFLLNIERGQMYVFYGFFFSLMYYCYVSKWKYNQFISGLIHGLFIFYRPIIIVIGLGFLVHWKLKWLAGSTTGFLLGCLLFIAPNPSLWQDYFKAMKEYNFESLGKGHKIEDAKEPIKPAIIEGTTNLDRAQGFNIKGLSTIHNYLRQLGINITNGLSIIFYTILLGILSLLLYRQKNKNQPAEGLFLFGFLAYILLELFMIVPRGDYNSIQWLPVLMLIAVQLGQNLSGLIILASALLLIHNFPFVLPYQSTFAELILLGLTGYLVFYKSLYQNINYGHSRAGS